MANVINATSTGNGGLVSTGDDSGILNIQTNETTAITVDTSQNVGIGTSSPASDTANERILQVNAPTTFATVSLSTSRANASGDNIGKVSFDVLNNTATYRSRAQIVAQSTGSTTNKYGANMLFYTASDNTTDATERMRIDSSGNLLVGTTDSSSGATAAKLRIIGSSANNLFVGSATAGGWRITSDALNDAGTFYHIKFTENGTQRGSITSNGTVTVYATTSDYRLKENVKPMTGALAIVSQLKPVTYDWIENKISGQGFIAHELQEVIPNAVVGGKDSVDSIGNPQYQQIDSSILVATLTAAIQELKAINDTQAETINALTARIVALEGQ
jgi:hypothetical protein